MEKELTDEIIEKNSLFDYKRDIVHFALGILIGIGIVFLLAYEKIIY